MTIQETGIPQWIFEDKAIEDIPPAVADILLTERDENTDMYKNCMDVQRELEALGWTCDFDLGGEIFDVKKLEQ